MAKYDWRDGGEGRITAGGKSLECASWGPAPAEAPTILMLHEGLGSVGLWRGFPEKVAKATDCGVFAWSRAGYGRSDPAELPRPIDYMTREAIDVLPEVLDAVGARHCILLGHSDGATIAAEYAGGVEDFRVRGIILMAPHFFTEPGGSAEIARSREAYETGGLKEKMARWHDNPDIAFHGWNDAWARMQEAGWNVAECIDYIRVPALVIQGRDDQYGTLAQVEEVETRSYAPVDTLILDDCQHAPHLEQPEKTLAAIAEFAARLWRIEAAEVEVA